ncbi:MAG: hypothetical protein B6I24_06650 [Bacteroidetes bacterium 4572_128]|nr:MAG: hypothetical protein B6I24_06650 [Bacteroidetes bacterium 4572_128]
MHTIILNDSNIDMFKSVHQDDNYTLIIEKGKAVGLFTSFSKEILQLGLIQWLLIKGYQGGDISLGQLAKQLKLSLTETMVFLSNMNIPVVDYDLDDDLRTIEKWNNENNS